MAKVYIDNVEYEVKEDQDMLSACQSLRLDLPYFCWHPAMGSVGACRLCAVKQFKDENDTQGRITMACMTPAKDGTRISIDDPEAKQFRKRVIEWLMVNHPHDCPICDEGGNCHLQDMTVMTGHAYRRFRFNKRTYRNQNLGPFINHEMNRCIQCYRCVRFYQDYAGGHDLQEFAVHDHVYFGRHEDGALESEFSGNLVEVCPTGVFTDKTYKQHYTRKWDMQMAPSVCHHCGLGCNIIPGERYGSLRTIFSRYNNDVNGYFLCDRGRFGYEHVNREGRPNSARLQRERGSDAQPVSKQEALEAAADAIRQSRSVIGIGSPRASLEANFALRQLVGADRFYSGMSDNERGLVSETLELMQRGPAPTASLEEARQADAALVLGEDLHNTAPMLALAMQRAVKRQPMNQVKEQMNIAEWHAYAINDAVQQQKGPFYVATVQPTKLDEIASRVLHAAPQDIARLGYAVAYAIDVNSPKPPNLSEPMRKLANEIAEALSEAQRPLVVSGTSSGDADVLRAAANVAGALHRQNEVTRISLTVPEANSMGLAMMGGGELGEALQALQNGDADTVIILENDLYRRAGRDAVARALSAAENVIAIDHQDHDIMGRANVSFPAGAFAEGSGTLINNEGRAQRFYQVYVPKGQIQSSWRWIRDVMRASGRGDEADWENLDEIEASVEKQLPQFKGIAELTPLESFRIAGQKIPRQPARYSGRTAMHAHVNVHEPKPPQDPDSPLAYSMEGSSNQPPASLAPWFWSPGWNSPQAINRFQIEVGGPLHGGAPGKRLIEPADGREMEYIGDPPAAFQVRGSALLAVPLHRIFGSEELSMRGDAIAERAASPHLALHPDDAASQRVKSGDSLRLSLNGAAVELPVKVWDGFPRGAIGVTVGYPNVPALELPAWGTIETGSTA